MLHLFVCCVFVLRMLQHSWAVSGIDASIYLQRAFVQLLYFFLRLFLTFFTYVCLCICLIVECVSLLHLFSSLFISLSYIFVCLSLCVCLLVFCSFGCFYVVLFVCTTARAGLRPAGPRWIVGRVKFSRVNFSRLALRLQKVVWLMECLVQNCE